MKWIAGPRGGGWFALAEVLSGVINRDCPELHLQVVEGGGRENPRGIESGEAQLGMSVDFLAAAACRGAAPYEGAPMRRIRTLGAGWSPLPFHLLRAASHTADLRAALSAGGFRIAVPPPETSDELTFRRVLAFYGSSYETIAQGGGLVRHGTYDAIVAALRLGEVDYLFGATTLPAAIIAAAGEGPCSIRLAPMPPDLTAHLRNAYGYGSGLIAASTYPALQSADIATTFMETIFMISAQVPEEAAYGIARSLLARREEIEALSPATAAFAPYRAWQNPAVPIHPGALRAYRDLGYAP